ncbi:hypothetical protein Esi_0000_0113 [Ectocarpus siliculosus]|uniref:Uncharacterized protein n=1 Tax=Ectocarpus siliculosus TaxID=2880 RepID=D8LAZ4_ECTSI|nr:hypothetical protein Esi_0000_0113 [Ectocarpus siliculosus]|eukprot:CBN76503.1 hypothetical protein Esi_0000_0113 [Ectocarpus siliculosus]
MLAKIRRAAILRAVRNRNILSIMVSAETLVQEQLDEAKFFVKNVIALRDFKTQRAARIIQGGFRHRAEVTRRSAAMIVRATRRWLMRGSLRRARIRRGIRRYRGSLSRRNLGLKETSPFALTVAREFPREGRWWDSGLPVAPRPKWGTLRVENEEARSRHRALSLADLIRTGQQKSDDDGGGGRAGNARASMAPAEGGGGVGGTSPTWEAKGWGSGSSSKGNAIGIEATGGGRRNRNSNSMRTDAGGTAATIGMGFSKGASVRRAASMVDPREAEKAALMDEIERRHARRTAVAPPFNTLSIVEKHQQREREFQEQREKRRAAAERETRRKEKQRAREIAEAARRKALEAELLAEMEKEKARKRLEKIREYKEKKAARELAEKKSAAAKREEERRAQAAEEAKRLAAEASFERERANWLERAKRKPRAEEKAKRRKDGRGRGAEGSQDMSATAPVHHRTKKHAAPDRTRPALASMTTTTTINTNHHRGGGRKRQRWAACPPAGGGSGNHQPGGVTGGESAISSSCSTLPRVDRSVRVAAGVRDGRRKVAPHGATVPALPVVPGYKAMAAGGTGCVEKRKRPRRRPPKGNAAAQGGRGRVKLDGGATTCATDVYDEILNTRNGTADPLPTSGGDGAGMVLRNSGGEVGFGLRNSVLQESVANILPGGPREQHQREVEEEDEEEAEVGRGSGHRSSCLAEDECLSTETLDSVFAVPESGVGSGGGGGEANAPEGLGGLSPGWSSRSSRRSSEEGDTSSGFLSDSAAIREGKALLSDGPVGGWGKARTEGGVTSAAATAAAVETVVGGIITEARERHAASFSPGEVGAGQAGPKQHTIKTTSPAALPDNVSDVTDNQMPIDQRQQEQEQQQIVEDELTAQSPTSSLSSVGNGEYDVAETETEIGVESADLLEGGRLYTADDDEHKDVGGSGLGSFESQ